MANLSIRELIIRKTAVQLNVNESTIEKIIKHKEKVIHDVCYLYSSIEDSGLGKFEVRPKVITKKISELTAKLNRHIEQGNAHIVESVQEEIDYLESKI